MSLFAGASGTRLKRQTTHVDAYTLKLKDGGSIPPTSTNFLPKGKKLPAVAPEGSEGGPSFTNFLPKGKKLPAVAPKERRRTYISDSYGWLRQTFRAKEDRRY